MPKFSLDWLLVFVPIAIVLNYVLPSQPVVVFFVAAIAIVPLAGLLGRATEALSHRVGEGAGGLLNATFGNAAELIIALFALRSGLASVVKASITGSILSNLLLVLGASLLGGGMRYKVQRFNPSGTRVQATALTLAAIALIVPAFYDWIAGPPAARREADISLEIAVVLFITYLAGLLFTLRTHPGLFAGSANEDEEPEWGARTATAVLAVSTVLVGWISEVLVGTVEEAARSLGMTSLFVGVVIVGIVGNAAEHATAVMMARKDKMDLAVGIAIGSSTQVALFVAPVLVFASWFIAPKPLDLVFTGPEVLAIALAVWIMGLIAGDGESNWLEGVQLLAVYFVLAIVFYYFPEPQPR